MKASSLLLLTLLAGFAAPVVSLPVFSSMYVLRPPETMRLGEAGFVSLIAPDSGLPAGDYLLSVEYADGSSSPQYHGFEVITADPVVARMPVLSFARTPQNKRRLIRFLVSVPFNASLGMARMSVSTADGTKLASLGFTVAERVFIREDLRLDTAMTSLRVDPDPRKTEQAARYQALLATVDPVAAYFDGGFVMPVQTERRTSLFATRRRYIYSNGSVDVTLHNGIDYGCPVGTPVVAAGAGRVVMADDRIVTGKTIILEHLPGTYTIYMHLDTMVVSTGNLLKGGDPIGTVGKTGLATGPHLHWELRIMGIASDPESLLGLDKVPVLRTIPVAIEGR